MLCIYTLIWWKFSALRSWQLGKGYLCRISSTIRCRVKFMVSVLKLVNEIQLEELTYARDHDPSVCLDTSYIHLALSMQA